MACLFYEPSTRTSMSFATAMQRLGGQHLMMNSVESLSVAKGETLADTIRTLSSYADIFALRHPQLGAVREAAKWTTTPIINAGDGTGEHPTQALLDVYTMQREIGRIGPLTVALLGDLRYGRTAHSLLRLLCQYPIIFRLVSAPSLRMPEEVIGDVIQAGCEITEHSDLNEVIEGIDVLYVTRVQRERFASAEEFEKVKNAYILTPNSLKGSKPNLVVMHPLPRINEIAPEIDADPRAAYFRQVENGLYIRMALLAAILGKG